MCDCATKANALLVREKWCRLAMSVDLSTGEEKPVLGFEAIAGTKKPKGFLVPTYCPFCGMKYSEGNNDNSK